VPVATENPMASTAWMLALDDRLRAAVGEHKLIHLIEAPTLLEVPLSPYYCRRAILWNNLLLPAMDLAAWLRGREQPAQQERKLAGVVAYQPQMGAAEYGVLLLSDIPARTHVSDTQACKLPEQPTGWRDLAISCFLDAETPVPILDLPLIFSGRLLVTR